MTDYEIGGYRVSASSEYTSDENSIRRVWNAYADGGAWMTEFDVFGRNASSNNNAAEVAEVTITDTDGASHIGHYTILETPFRLRTGYLSLSATVDSRRPESVVILGSNDNENWDLLYTNTSVPDQNDNTLVVGSTKGYKYHMFMVKNLDPNGEGAMYITRIKYFGHKEGDLTRFPEPTRVLKYPHIAMTGPGQRGYVASASSSHTSYPPNFAFNNIISGNDAWINNSGSATPYNSSTGAYSAGVYSTTVAGHGAATGEFLQIEFPHKVKSTEFKLASYTTQSGSQRAPRVGVIAGSNNGTTWDLLKSFTGLTSWTTGTFQTLTPDTNTTTYYKYFRLIVEAVNASNDGLTSVHGFEIYGTQENTQTPAIVGGHFAGKVANFRV
jgi:hypothetical protein